MASMLRSRPHALVALLAVAICAVVTSPESQARRRAPRTLLYEITQIKLAKGTPAVVRERTKARLAAAIDKHDRLIGELAADAPDPDKDPEAYKKYLRRHRVRAFKVNLEILAYESKVEPVPGPKSGNYVVVHIALRLFGVTIPDRRMAFAGDGSATIKVEVGSRVRERDQVYAEKQAVDLAIAAAIEHSIEKLEGKKRSRKRRKKN